jgi:hypothetical protein
MRFGQTAVAVLVAVLLTPAAALAQYSAQKSLEDPDFYVTAYYNFNFGGDVYKGLGDSSLKKSNSHGLGGSFTVLARHLISAELDFNYSHSFFGSSDTLSRNTILTATLDGVVGRWFKAGPGRIRPYVLVGGGYMRAIATNRRKVGWSAPEKNLGLVEAGGGVLWLLNDSFGIRADARYRYGLGAKEDGSDYGLFNKFTYVKSTAGLSIAF